MTDDARTAPDQPPPVKRPDRPPIWPLVINDVRALAARRVMGSLGDPSPVIEDVAHAMAERDRVGREEYGTPLTAGNGRDHLIDAYQELLDASVYLRAEIEKRGPYPANTPPGDPGYVLITTYLNTLALVLVVAEQINVRKDVP